VSTEQRVLQPGAGGNVDAVVRFATDLLLQQATFASGGGDTTEFDFENATNTYVIAKYDTVIFEASNMIFINLKAISLFVMNNCIIVGNDVALASFQAPDIKKKNEFWVADEPTGKTPKQVRPCHSVSRMLAREL
jgi:hypothetical protein